MLLGLASRVRLLTIDRSDCLHRRWDQLRTTIISLNNLQKYVKKKEDEVAAGLHRKKAGAP